MKWSWVFFLLMKFANFLLVLARMGIIIKSIVLVWLEWSWLINVIVRFILPGNVSKIIKAKIRMEVDESIEIILTILMAWLSGPNSCRPASSENWTKVKILKIKHLFKVLYFNLIHIGWLFGRDGGTNFNFSQAIQSFWVQIMHDLSDHNLNPRKVNNELCGSNI